MRNGFRWLAAALALACLGCHEAPRPKWSAAPPQETAAALPPRVWTLEHPPGPGENAVIQEWRRRYDGWRTGTLRDYPFEPRGAKIEPADHTGIGHKNGKGEIVTEEAVDIPDRSIHETEPWGDKGCVWPVRNRWSMRWEEEFSRWMSTEVDADYLARYNIPVDCADAPYAFRWIFARMHYLPQGAHNVYGAVFGNWNTRFANLPHSVEWSQDLRFRAALDYVMSQYVQGRSIPYDTYPISLRPQAGALRPGTVIADKNHVRIIHRIVPNAYRPVRHLSATLPSKVRTLADEALSAATPCDGVGWGIVDWSWWDYDFARHRYICVPDRKMPGFNLEQYDNRNSEIPAGLIHTLYRQSLPGTGVEGVFVRVREMLGDVCVAIRMRKDVVDAGWAHYKDRPNDRDKKSRPYDDFSTPHRDERIEKTYEEVRKTAAHGGMSEHQLRAESDKISIDIGEGQSMSLTEFLERLDAGKVSHEPWDPPYRRWGLKRPES